MWSLVVVITIGAMERLHGINLFSYLDYRQFLRDWYLAAKKSRGSFSFRTFSKKAGFHSPNFFKLVMDGDRNLTEKSLSHFVTGLGLNKQEEEFFRNLVFFNQAKIHEQKDHYYQKLIQSRKFGQLKPIEKDQYDFYSTWYHPVIRELVVSKDFDGTPEWLVDRIHPKITWAQATKSIELLEKLGFIRKSPEGKWAQSTPLVTTGAESSSLVLLNYHQSLLGLTQQLLPEIPPEERDISAVTLGVAASRVPELKQKIQDFRREILEMVSTETEPEKVLSLTIQLLPLGQTGRPNS